MQCKYGILKTIQIESKLVVFGWSYLQMQSYRGLPKIEMAQRVKNLPAMQETQALSLGWEDLLEKEMATHSSIFAWRIPWTEEPRRLQSMRLQRVGHD